MSNTGEIRHDVDFDLTQIVNEMARRIAKERDQRVLDLLEHAYGFVRPVRCRDCEHIHEFDLSAFHDGSHEHDHYSCARLLDPGCISVEPDGFCAWGRRADA